MGKRSLNGLIATVIGVVMILMYQDHLPEAGAYDQQASQPTKGLQTNLYHWLDGEYDRLLYLVRMDYTSDPPAPVFRRSPDGPDMVLPGGVTLILGNSWTDVNARRLFEKHKVPHNRVEKLPNMNGAYYIHTEPGFPSLNLANKMAKNGDVVAATPTWRGGTLALTQQPTDQEQSSDHHGDSHEDATQLDLIQTFTGTIEPGDKDYFSITLSNEQAGTYIFYPRATESILGGKYLIAELVDGDGRCLQRQCNLPGRSPKVKLQSGANYFRIRPVDTLTEGAGYHLYLIREEPYDRWMQECAAIQSKYEDPLYGCQWHLKNTEFNGRLKSPRAVGSDINVEPVWDAGILGEGIRIQIVDTGMDSRHEDLVDNVDRASNYKIGSQQGWGQPVLNLNNWHGVEMAGLIAARDNDKGIRGVAPRATIFMEDSLGRPASVNSHTVMRGKDISAISSNSWVISNSWSNTGSPTLITQSADYRSAVEDAVNSGFGGKGVFFSTGSGAYSSKGKGTTNTSEREAHYALTAVCVVGEDGAQVERLNRRSPWGYTNWVCSPGEGATTGNFDSYVRGGSPSTSAATAIISGVAALVRSANRELTWRDVKLILAGTTQKNDPDHPEWETGARKYYNPEQNYGYSPLYGFGVVDAAAAVEAAQSWSNLPDMITKSRSNGGWMRIKDAPVVGELKTHKSNIRISTDMDFIEFVEVHVDFDHDEARDLRITLESPSGATSTLLTPYVSISNTEFRETFRFGSARHLGENPNGVWTLRVTDEVPGQSGLIKGWKLVVRGHRTPAVWESELTAGQTTDILPAASGYSIFGNLGGTLSPDVFVIDGTTYKVLVLAHGSESLFLGLDEELPVDFTLRVGESTYVGSESMAPPATKVTALYWWPSPPPDWFAGDPAQVSLTIHPGVPLGDRQKAPVTGYFRNFPSEHDGNEDVSFRIYFSEGVATTADALHDHVLAVSGGAVSGVKAVGDEGRIWAVSVKPDSMDAVTVEIEAGLDCEVAGAVCAADGRRLFNYMKLIVAGGQLTVDEPMPESENSPATGAPVISGTAQEGETLTADTSGLADADGLDNAVFSYQWISNDGTTGADIQDATDSTYTLAADDAGKTIKVWVSFTDDVGNEESLTSAPTEAVAVLVWAATLTAGSSGTYSGYNLRQSAGSLSPNEFSLGAIEYSVKLVLEDDEGKLSFGLDQALLTVFTLHVGALRFASENASPVEGDHAYTYQWDKRTVDWSVGEEVELSLTLPETPLMAVFEDSPEGHDGENAFTFELRFSEEPDPGFSYQTLRDHAFTVSGGAVTNARRLDRPSNIRWEITVRPDSDADVIVVLPVSEDCNAQGAVCTEDGRMLSNRVELTVTGPPGSVQNTPATGLPTIGGAAQVGERLTAETSGIDDADGMDNPTFGYQWIANDGNGDGDIQGATEATYTLTGSDVGKTIKVQVSFSDGRDNEETLTSEPTEAVEPMPTPLTASIHGAPEGHDGENAFTFELRFSEEFDLGYVTLRDHAFTVSGGEVTEARRLDRPSNIRWEIVVRPDSDADVIVVLPVTENCETPGAVCTEDGGRLSNRVELTVTGPPGSVQNTPATGEPAISGAAQVGERLTAETSGIDDADGMRDATFSYQWIANDGTSDSDIEGATESTYTLTDSDVGKTIKVQVSFSDGRDNEETLTSEPTEAVEPAPNSPATGEPTISGAVQVGETLTADTSGISDADAMDNATFSYQWIANDGNGDGDIEGETASTYTLVSEDEGKTVKVRVSFSDDDGNEETLTSGATAAISPVPIGEEETEEDGPIWSATMTAGLLQDGYGYSSFAGGAGELSETEFELDGVTYTIKAVVAWGWMYIGVDKELPMDFRLEVDGKQLDSRDASLTSYSYASVYQWEEAQLEWAEGDTIELALYRADTNSD